MIEGLKQDSISLNKGIHRTPSLGADGELSECVNLIPKEGEIVALPEPKELGITLPEGAELLHSHETSSYKHYIVGVRGEYEDTEEEEEEGELGYKDSGEPLLVLMEIIDPNNLQTRYELQTLTEQNYINPGTPGITPDLPRRVIGSPVPVIQGQKVRLLNLYREEEIAFAPKGYIIVNTESPLEVGDIVVDSLDSNVNDDNIIQSISSQGGVFTCEAEGLLYPVFTTYISEANATPEDVNSLWGTIDPVVYEDLFLGVRAYSRAYRPLYTTGTVEMSSWVYSLYSRGGSVEINGQVSGVVERRPYPVAVPLTQDEYSLWGWEYYIINPIYLKAGRSLTINPSHPIRGYFTLSRAELFEGFPLPEINQVPPFTNVGFGPEGNNLITAAEHDRWIFLVIQNFSGELTYEELCAIHVDYKIWRVKPYVLSSYSGLAFVPGESNNDASIVRVTAGNYHYKDGITVHSMGHILGNPVELKEGEGVGLGLNYVNPGWDSTPLVKYYILSDTLIEENDQLPNSALQEMTTTSGLTADRDCYVYPVFTTIWSSDMITGEQDFIPLEELYEKTVLVMGECIAETAGDTNKSNSEASEARVVSDEEAETQIKDYALYYLVGSNTKLIGYINSATTPKVVSIGNTLVTSTDGGILYYLWKGLKYKKLGNHIPQPKVRATLSTGYGETKMTYTAPGQACNSDGHGEIYGGQQAGSYYNISEPVMAGVNYLETRIKQDGFFSYPFFLRYGLQLTDTELATHSLSPAILMIPSHYCEPAVGLGGTNLISPGGSPIQEDKELTIMVRAHRDKLSITIENGDDYKEWEDVVNALVLYVSPQIQTYNESASFEAGFFRRFDGWENTSPETYSKWKSIQGSLYDDMAAVMPVVGKFIQSTLQDYNESSPGTGAMYKLLSVPIKSIIKGRKNFSAPKTTGDFTGGIYNYRYESTQGEAVQNTNIATYDLLNLETQSSIDWATASEMNTEETLSPSVMYAYNGRLLLANAASVLPEESNGLWHSSPRGFATTAIVQIDNDDATHYIKIPNLYVNQVINYFYYPNSKATHLYVNTDTDVWEDYPLEIDLLTGGAYYFSGLAEPSIIPAAQNSTDGENYKSTYLPYKEEAQNPFYPVDEKAEWFEEDDNRLIKNDGRVFVSLQGSPFSFPKTLRVTIGSSEILALRATTQAVSTGQFGQYPLYIFSGEGVFAASISDEGKLSAVAPLLRDVISPSKELLQLDKALVFPTAQGLKLLENPPAISISDAVEGLNVDEAVFAIDPNLYVADTNDFRKQIQTAKMSYDYANGLIHVFTDDHNLGATRYKHYVYSLETGEWATQILDEPLKAVVPTYPLTTLQLGNKLYQYDKSVNATDVRDGWLLTRPFAMGNPVAHKMLNDLRVLGQKTVSGSQFKVSVYISNDRKKWYRLRSLKGQSAKWYRFLVKTKMTDLDTLSGIVYQYVERYNGKMR